MQVRSTQSEKGTCMKKPISMLCNTATSKLMPLSCHPITSEQQMMLQFYLELQTTKITALISLFTFGVNEKATILENGLV